MLGREEWEVGLPGKLEGQADCGFITRLCFNVKKALAALLNCQVQIRIYS